MNLLKELQILDRPKLEQPQWLIDVNTINHLPTPAIVAAILSINLDRLTPEEFRSIVQWLDESVRDRKKQKHSGAKS